MDTLTFAMVEDEDAGLGRLEVLLPQIVRNYADKTPIDRNPCGGTTQRYTIADNIHWSVVSDASSYFSWNAKGEAPQIEPKSDSSMGSTDWKFVGQPVDGYGYRDLPLIVGVKDELQLHVNLRNICGTSQSPALSVIPKPAVTQAPTITPASICLGAKLGFDCKEVDNALEYHWTFPWAPKKDITEIPHVDVPTVTDDNGDVKVRAYNECGFGPEATFNAMVIHTPKAPLPDWNPQGTYDYDNDTVTDVVCLHGGARRSSARDIQISNVVADDCDSLCSIIVTGMPDEPVRNVWLNNIRLHFRGGGAKELVNKEYREQGTNYPEPKFAGQTPAYGLYARHVTGLHVNDLTFSYADADFRPAVVLDDVDKATLRDIYAPTEAGVDKIVLFNCKDIDIKE